MELGEQKLSQLLRRRKELAKDAMPEDTLIMLWRGHLPSAVRAVLMVTETKDLNALASIADNVMVTTRAAHLAEVNQQPSTSKDTELIIAEIAKLSTRVSDLKRSRTSFQQRRSPYRFSRSRFGRSRSASRHRSTSQHRTPESPDWLCYYHHRFRDRAEKCAEPCAWKKPSEN